MAPEPTASERVASEPAAAEAAANLLNAVVLEDTLWQADRRQGRCPRRHQEDDQRGIRDETRREEGNFAHRTSSIHDPAPSSLVVWLHPRSHRALGLNPEMCAGPPAAVRMSALQAV
jgi:hypothetical protein